MMEGQKRIEKYQFNMKNLLGQGSYANVYMGRIIETGEKVAVKVIDKRLFANSYNVKNIQSEIQIMKKVDHPNIVKLYDVYQTTNNMYIITELCEDGDFYGLLQKKRKVDEEEAKSYLKQIMKGIKYLHMNGIIHRDLKPANILMKNGECKISDFGFAKNLEDENTIMKSIVGTPLYMSPQLLKKLKYTNKSDLWSIGLIYYEMLHGRTPWPASNELQLLNGIYSKKPSFHSSISSISKDFILKCLEIEEKHRMSWEDAFDHPLLKDHKVAIERSPSPCYSSKSGISTKNVDLELIKKASQIKARRIKLSEKYSRQNKENENDNNRSYLFDQDKKISQIKEKQRNLTPTGLSKNISEHRLKRVEAMKDKANDSYVIGKKETTAMTPRALNKGSSYNSTTINSKLKEVLALTPKGDRSELKKKATTYKSQINLNTKG